MPQKIKIRRGNFADLPAGGTEPGEFRYCIDTGQLFIDDGTNNVEITGGGGAVDSVFGRTGAVVAEAGDYSAADVGLGNVTNDEQLKAADLDTDGTLSANSDTKIPSQKAVKTYADQLIASADAMVFKGVIDASANPNYPAADKGWTYRISVAGKIGGASGVNVEIGDLLLCLVDGSPAGDQATVGMNWSIAQTNVDGAVIGPAGVTDDLPAVFDGVTGRFIKSKTYAAFKTLLGLVKGDVGLGSVDNLQQLPLSYLDTDGALAGNSDVKVPSQKAVKTYADALKRAQMIMKVPLYKAPITGGTATTTSAMVAGRCYFHVFPVPTPGVTTLADIMFDVTTGHASNARVGVFKITDGKDPANGVTLIADLGDVDLTAAAIKEVATSQVIEDEFVLVGLYVHNATPVFRAYYTTGNAGSFAMQQIGYHDTTNYAQFRPIMGWQVSSVNYSAGMPSTIASLTRLSGGALPSPLIAAKFTY